jgi:2-dehydro-3-deoxy-L-rhamnonate dehydrogenase (NAD+)
VAKAQMALGQDPQFLKMIVSKVPRGRMPELGEAAAMICFLAMAENSLATVSVLDLPGGRSTY